MNKYYNVEEIAEMVGKTKKVIQKYLQNGVIEGFKESNKWKVPKKDVELIKKDIKEFKKMA